VRGLLKSFHFSLLIFSPCFIPTTFSHAPNYLTFSSNFVIFFPEWHRSADRVGKSKKTEAEKWFL
jgi:hypothetical protein